MDIDYKEYNFSVVSSKDFKPFPSATGRQRWLEIPEHIKLATIRSAESYIHYDRVPIPASEIYAYFQEGDRDTCDRHYTEIVSVLATLVQAECMEYRGRFLKTIINMVWGLCEQTLWALPPHYNMMGDSLERDFLAHPPYHLFDLAAGEIGSTLAITHYLLGDIIAEIHPGVCERIRSELNLRIIDPFLERTDFWWMGYTGDFVNNWAPWCTSNALMTILLMEQDSVKRRESIEKSCTILNKFLKMYGEDGGCDEGSTYWFRAGASLFECLELISLATEGSLSWFNQPLIRSIGEYIKDMHIGANYFINFADGQHKLHANWKIIYRYGKRVSSQKMVDLAIELAKLQYPLPELDRDLLRELPFLFLYDQFSQEGVQKSSDSSGALFQDIEASTRRGTTPKGMEFFVAVKGGHNNESHNHNDVGQYILYADNEPLLVDVGCGVYTKKTFSSERYTIWTMQSQFHNLPQVGGIMQAPGKEFRAMNFHATQDSDYWKTSLDIAKAYPREARILEWQRTVTLQPGQRTPFCLDEKFLLSQATDQIEIFMITPWRPTVEASEAKIYLQTAKNRFAIQYPAMDLSVEIEKIELTDTQLIQSWGEYLYRIIYRLNTTTNSGSLHFALCPS